MVGRGWGVTRVPVAAWSTSDPEGAVCLRLWDLLSLQGGPGVWAAWFGVHAVRHPCRPPAQQRCRVRFGYWRTISLSRRNVHA